MKSKPNSKKRKVVKGFALLIDGVVDVAMIEKDYLGPVALMALGDKKDTHIVPCTISFTLPKKP